MERSRILPRDAPGESLAPDCLAAWRKKAAARQANTTALAKLAIRRKVLGITSHAPATQTAAAPASSSVHFFFMGRKAGSSSTPPIPAPSPSTSITREGI